MMNKIYRYLMPVITVVVLVLSACSVNPSPEPVSQASTAAEQSEKWVLYAPASSSSIPIILAAEELGNVELTLYTSQEQASTLFARGDVDMLVTGLSVGFKLFTNDVPLQMVNTNVSGLSYLVTDGTAPASFADLKGSKVTVPFAGSPIEEVCIYLAEKEGLKWGTDIVPVYAPFESSITLLKQGQAGAVVLPEPSVSMVEGQPGVQVGFSLYDLWNRYNPNSQGYPQVGTFARSEWVENHPEELAAFHAALENALALIETSPAQAVEQVSGRFKMPAAVLEKALSRTYYRLYTGAEMRSYVQDYYQTIGKPIDEKFAGIYFIAEK